MKPEELLDLSVTVLGAGKSGIAAAELLRHAGAHPFLSEYGSISEQAKARLVDAGIPFEEGGHTARAMAAAFCVVSPGIVQTAPVLHEAARRGLPVYSEIEVASWFCPARVIGITGTDGKTTTATLMHRICALEGQAKGFRAFSVGNIGVPFSSKVLEMGGNDLAVLELSSYQLERCVTFRPEVAILTNITPDHMDRYGGSIQAYAQAKYHIHANQGAGETVVYNHDDPILREHFDRPHAFPFRLVRFCLQEPEGLRPEDGLVTIRDGAIVCRDHGAEEEVIRVDAFVKPSFRGNHNLLNALASVAAAKAAGISSASICRALELFAGVEHRQEFAGHACGLDWVNDSKATNINAMRQALLAVPAGMVLIAGGRDKGNDYASISTLLREKVSAVVAIGESQQKIVGALAGVVPVATADTLRDAVAQAAQLAAPGSTVLFSPGCSSFDMFRDFEDRGEQFKQLVRELAS